jgi:cytochrome c oxidase cbb3-type subunit 3
MTILGYKSGTVFALAAVVSVVTGLIITVRHHYLLMAARLVITPPDSVMSVPELSEYAQDRGGKAFLKYCASCHRQGGQPDRVRGIPSFQDNDWLYGTGRVSEIERVVLYGIRAGNSKGLDLANMPAFATPRPYWRYRMDSLTPSEIGDVTEYIYGLQHRDADPEASMRGKKLFYNQSRGLCWDCHGDHAQGDPAIGAPNLTDNIWLYGDGSRQSIWTSIAYGRSGSCPAWIGKLDYATITAIAVYTRRLSLDLSRH